MCELDFVLMTLADRLEKRALPALDLQMALDHSSITHGRSRSFQTEILYLVGEYAPRHAKRVRHLRLVPVTFLELV